MSPVCDHPHYADQIECLHSAIEQVRPLAQDTYCIRVAAPRIARQVVPGQFVMIRLADREAPLIGRALAVYDVIDDQAGQPQWIDLVFVRKGAMTTPLAEAPIGTRVSLWGPLGNGFSTTACELLVMAAGGVGQTPMLMVAKEASGARNYGLPHSGNGSGNGNGSGGQGGQGGRQSGWAQAVQMVYGARSAGLLAGVDDFRAAGIDLKICTDDGSAGTPARVPQRLLQLLDDALAEAPERKIRVVCCGPEIMMQKVAEGCLARAIPCEVSLETPMACGIGICFSCVAMVRPGPGQPWDYKRTCIEGPIFDSRKIVW